MPADPRWHSQAGQPWDGPDPHYGGYDMPGAGRAGWPRQDDGRFGYQPGGPPHGYGFQDPDGYAAGYQGQRGYETARPALSDQQQERHPRDATAGGGRADLPADGRPAGRRAAQARRTGPPAALPPGPSASGTQASGHERDAAAQEPGASHDQGRPAHAAEPASAARPEPFADAADLAGSGGAVSEDRPSRQSARTANQADGSGDRSQPSAVTAATPPSPTGTLPPAVTEVPGAGPPDVDSQPGHDGYEIVSPDAETTPMAVILGDQPPEKQQAAEPATPAAAATATTTTGVPRRAGSVPPPERTGQHREPGHADPARSGRLQPPVQRVRGPFEPPAKSDPVENGAPPPAGAPEPRPAHPGAGTIMSQATRASVWSPATAKMDQIKDLYLTAEAIGEDALDKHFEQVSDRQRQLIREYFDGNVPSGAESSDAAS
jgi:hypothetical protein